MAENWAEIGAYGEGMRPQIRRNRHINERCGLVQDAAYLAVRDIVDQLYALDEEWRPVLHPTSSVPVMTPEK